MAEFILTDIQANQILVWSELDNGFINVTPSSSQLNIDDVTHEALSPNTNIISSISDNIVRTKGIVGGENVTITDNGSDIIIDVNRETLTDAETLFGFPHQAFVKKNELDSLINYSDIESNLNFYSKEYIDEILMSNNASNIPDMDNVYDLGSNGRRYADVYAKTFHGTATNAISSNTLARNGADDGDVLTWENGSWIPKPFVLESVTFTDTLSNIDTVGASDGFYLAYNGTDYELRELPTGTGGEINTDLLADVDTSTAVNGDVLTWDGSGYTLSDSTPTLALNDLTDVNITNPQLEQVLSWNGSEFTLTTLSSGGINNLSELNDVDGTIVPENGDVLTYNSTKSQYEPLPIPVSNGNGGTVYEILKVNYTANGNYGSAEYITNNIQVTGVVDSDLTLLEVTFTGYTFPPMSIGYWGYVYDENLYRYIGITEGVSFMGTSGLGVSGSPTLFDPNRVDKEYTITVSARTNETQSSPSSDFPPNPTHAYVVFVMGG